MKTLPLAAIASAAVITLVSGCAGNPAAPTGQPVFSQTALPDAVKVPAGHQLAMETVGVGEITYECRQKAAAGAALAPGFEWVFVGPKAVLNDRNGRAVSRYFGPPATWAAMDGSQLTGTQLAVAPATPGSIPLQLVKANPAMGAGAMNGVTYIQRVATQGGVAPSTPCDAQTRGRQEIVKYQADYIFWKAA